MHLRAQSGYWTAAVAVGVMALLLSVPAAEAQTVADRPNLAGFEFLGRGLIYSTNYERHVRRVGFGAGIASWRIDSKTIAIIPLYVSFRPIGDTHSLYLSGGATVGSDISTLFSAPRAVFGTASVGYEHFSKSGLVIRPTFNLMFGGEVLPWPGLMIGYRF